MYKPCTTVGCRISIGVFSFRRYTSHFIICPVAGTYSWAKMKLACGFSQPLGWQAENRGSAASEIKKATEEVVIDPRLADSSIGTLTRSYMEEHLLGCTKGVVNAWKTVCTVVDGAKKLEDMTRLCELSK